VIQNLNGVLEQILIEAEKQMQPNPHQAFSRPLPELGEELIRFAYRRKMTDSKSLRYRLCLEIRII